MKIRMILLNGKSVRILEGYNDSVVVNTQDVHLALGLPLEIMELPCSDFTEVMRLALPLNLIESVFDAFEGVNINHSVGALFPKTDFDWSNLS
ncbi:hypothetical protein LRP49_00575 [Enterovibrio sp. ZSDZ35]|uniref:Uncharacterized protein n=1 Tax=Enterovibrio qingdaonensis TaxID=2899818 RepID=A0ABT5QFB9_9GAMM|nr:hypothetical protein [Enterovibrio sp. ZSDZ35]MDD1779675.1 hypothetical protein [Enterovibrio sp. ZSDZ35]